MSAVQTNNNVAVPSLEFGENVETKTVPETPVVPPNSESEIVSVKNNKSQAVRAALIANPNAEASDIVELLAKNGVFVATSLVYMIRGKLRTCAPVVQKVRKPKPQSSAAPTKPTAKPVIAPVNFNIDTVRRIKTLAQEVGGYDQLRQIVDVVSI